MSIWELPVPPVWWWLLVGGIIILFIYLWKRTLENIEGYVLSPREEMQREVTKSRISEIVAWTFMPIGLIIYIYAIFESSPFSVFLVASSLIVMSYIVGTHFRRQRLQHQRELEKIG